MGSWTWKLAGRLHKSKTTVAKYFCECKYPAQDEILVKEIPLPRSTSLFVVLMKKVYFGFVSKEFLCLLHRWFQQFANDLKNIHYCQNIYYLRSSFFYYFFINRFYFFKFWLPFSKAKEVNFFLIFRFIILPYMMCHPELWKINARSK